MPLRFLAVTAAVVAFVSTEAWSRGITGGITDATASRVACDKVASPLGSNSNPGTMAKPYATVDRLASSLRAGQAGCLRAGVYQRDVAITRGGSSGAPITITSFPGERATVIGRLHVAEEANNVVVQELDLDGRNRAGLPSPTINGDNVVFRDNDVTNQHTTICFLLGSTEWGRARDTVIEHNRIHNCGELPPTNHHHGIYVEVSQGARITGNWIYDNADRGVQLFPDAQGTYVGGNVIDGNGQGVVFSRDSGDNVVEHNVLSNPLVRYNIESYNLFGSGNVARRNCVWSTRHWGNAGIQLDIGLPVPDNLVTEPAFVDRERKDFRLLPGSPCVTLGATYATPRSPVVKARKRGGRPVRLRASAPVVWPGRRLLLQARTLSETPPAAASQRPVLRVLRKGKWRRVGAMQTDDGSYVASVRLAKRGRRSRAFGRFPVPRALRTLQLRAFVRGGGHSNIVAVRIRR